MLLLSLLIATAHAEMSPRLPGSLTHAPRTSLGLTIGPEGLTHASLTKAEALEQLRALQSKETDEINHLEDSVKKLLQDSTQVTLREELPVADAKIKSLTDQIAALDTKRTEHLARRAFIDHLVLIVDSKYTGQGLNAFLETQMLDYAQSDLTNPQGSTGAWKFATSLSIVMREVPEPHENPLSVLESYMDYAGVVNPKTPAAFLAQRAYTSGGLSVAAHPSSHEAAGDAAAKMVATQSPPKNKKGVPTLELRVPRSSPLEDSVSGSTQSANEPARKMALPKQPPKAPQDEKPPAAEPDGPYLSPALRTSTN